MTTIHEMDEFVNWDNAADAVNPSSSNQQPDNAPPPTDPDLDLVLANVDDDDFSFWALQHFNGAEGQDVSLDAFPLDNPPAGGAGGAVDSSSAFPDLLPEPLPELWWVHPKVPCANCTAGGFQCKKIAEGQYKGYCTSCVALRVDCSFGLDSQPRRTQTQLSSQAQSPLEEEQQSATATMPAGNIDPVSLLSSSLSEAPAPLPAVASASDNTVGDGALALGPNKNSPPPKIGARFSRESVKTLKNWLTSHNRHPYPTDEEKEMLQRQTGLNKTQITNWLANARRRGKVQPPRSTSPHVRNTWTGPMDIPRRPGTPAPGGGGDRTMINMNPLERWVDSPPEHEPASVSAIARAVASNSDVSSGLNSPHSHAFTDDSSGRSLWDASSASSAGTSSGGSFASAYSHASRNSFGSFGSMNNNSHGRRRRRRRAAPKRAEEKTSLSAPRKTFQCTFCTETFRTKHDWQRHEKSLHLSLERWVCAPDGPRMLNPLTNQVCCVFCGDMEPDEAHIESHNHSACQEKSLEERTFYRKDHLNQHLKLVHNVKFLDIMKTWKVASPEIRSRCGFCGIVMDTWSIRVDHLAEHFKTGNTMADWKGDWGFDAPVLNMVENSIPPYLIDNERTSPYPYVATGAPAESPRSAYELIKMELAYFMMNHEEKTGQLPNDEQMQLEACRIIFASEVLSLQGISSNMSWLRDLLMSSEQLARQAQFGPLRSAIENRLSILKINGKDNLFEQCPLEQQLHEYSRNWRLLGLTAMDDELQEEACGIVGRIEEVSTTPSDFIANWLVRLIKSSTSWLANFRQRAHLPRTEDIGDINLRPTDSSKIDSTIHNYSRLERALSEYLDERHAEGVEATDEDLQRMARITIYEFDDGWNQTAADNVDWLSAFRKRHAQQSAKAKRAAAPTTLAPSAIDLDPDFGSQSVAVAQRMQLEAVAFGQPIPQQGSCPQMSGAGVEAGDKDGFNPRFFFLNDANCYRRLARELSRYVASTASPNNPNQHVPSDEELRHQARWILYNEDDPWNQTAADNAEWLLRFKRDVGILPPGPGLLLDGAQWHLHQGGTGFAPPYAFPSKNMLSPPATVPNPDSRFINTSQASTTPAGDSGSSTTQHYSTQPVTTKGDSPTAGSPGSRVQVPFVDNTGANRYFQADPAMLAQYLESFDRRYQRPAVIFCSRELEAALVELVRDHVARGGGSQGHLLPSDDALRARARAVYEANGGGSKTAGPDGMTMTPADDPSLLGRFKDWVTGQLGLATQEQPGGEGTMAVSSALPQDLKMDMTDAEMDSIWADMNHGIQGVGNDGGAGLDMGAGDLGGSAFRENYW